MSIMSPRMVLGYGWWKYNIKKKLKVLKWTFKRIISEGQSDNSWKYF
jgi:hypothetical protein